MWIFAWGQLGWPTLSAVFNTFLVDFFLLSTSGLEKGAVHQDIKPGLLAAILHTWLPLTPSSTSSSPPPHSTSQISPSEHSYVCSGLVCSHDKSLTLTHTVHPTSLAYLSFLAHHNSFSFVQTCSSSFWAAWSEASHIPSHVPDANIHRSSTQREAEWREWLLSQSFLGWLYEQDSPQDLGYTRWIMFWEKRRTKNRTDRYKISHVVVVRNKLTVMG